MANALRRMDSSELLYFLPPLLVGRDPTHDLVIDHPDVSREHAWIRIRNGAWVVEDRSTNGTTVNGRRVPRGKEQPLKPGDILRFAGVAAWEVVDLEPTLASSLPETHRPQPTEADPTPVALSWDADGQGGTLRVGHGEGAVTRRIPQLPLSLLDTLAEAATAWVDNPDLRTRLWGRQERSPSALAKLVFDTRDLLRETGLDGALLDTDRGRVRLLLSRVERVPRPMKQ